MIAGEKPAFMGSGRAVGHSGMILISENGGCPPSRFSSHDPAPVATTRSVRETVCYQPGKRTALRSGCTVA
jgi:hypothetical protein